MHSRIVSTTILHVSRSDFRDGRDDSVSGDSAAGPEAAADRLISEVVALYRDFPAWAVWLPVQGVWTAVRSASDRPAGPGLQLLWTRANSARQLAIHMREANQEIDDA